MATLVWALSAMAADPQSPEDENARLRARVEELERENARLRGEVRDAAAAPAIPTRVVETVWAGGAPVWATAPAEIDARGRAVHRLWIERAPGAPGATLWIRTEFSGGIYRHTEHLELVLDGKTHTLPVTSHDATRITTGGRNLQRRDHEVVSAAVPPDVLAALADASTMTGRLGRTAFTVPAEALASLRALARKGS